MARFKGAVGYAAQNVETVPGVFRDVIVERTYFGDVVRNIRRLEDASKVNFDIVPQNSISVVADAYANEHFHAIRYVQWSGTLWIVTSVSVERPRLLMELGGVYNGPTPSSP